MSTATLLKKTQAKYKISGRSKNVAMGVIGPHGNKEFASKQGGGFSLNGVYRNKGRVGANSLFSPVRSQNLVQVTTRNGRESVKRGWGGCCGKYKTDKREKAKVVCSDESKISKPSVLNTKGMLSYKHKWKKTNTNIGDYPGQIQTIYNNWVKEGTSNEFVQTNTQGQYIKRVSVINSNCIPSNLDKNAGMKNCSVDGVRCGYHIGGKYKPPTRYAKFTKIATSNVALNRYIERRGLLNPYGFQKPFPIVVGNAGKCSDFIGKQANDPLILENYYLNNVNIDIDVKKCSNENKTCSGCGGYVVYGGKFRVKGAPLVLSDKIERGSNINCSNLTFGDPIPGVAKACYCLNAKIKRPCKKLPDFNEKTKTGCYFNVFGTEKKNSPCFNNREDDLLIEDAGGNKVFRKDEFKNVLKTKNQLKMLVT